MAKKTVYWHECDNGKIKCDLCPRGCLLDEDQRGFCFVRGRQNNEIVLHAYGKTSGIAVDPIEKKPLNHFYPNSKVLSFGTAGCNLGCKFCQNWDISKSRETEILSRKVSPDEMVKLAVLNKCKSIAFTYNDPVIFLEYAADIANLARLEGIQTVAVTAGYINPEPRKEFFSFIDAANVDLKSFNPDFYSKFCSAELAPILETLEYIKKETNVWLEITTLLIPGENDSSEEIDQMTRWIAQTLGPSVPVHFSAFHPAWKVTNKERTPVSTLKRSREIAIKNGLYYVFTGNVHDPEGASTYCHNCKKPIIKRDWYELLEFNLEKDGKCKFCGTQCYGRF